MANMFSGKSKKQVPKTLDECVQPDRVSTNLWVWAERIERIGVIVFVFLIVFGIIDTISTGITTYREVDAISIGDEAAVATVLAVFTSLFSYALYAFIEFCAYHAIALLIGALASIVQNTNVSANLALYSIKGKSGDKFTEEASAPRQHESKSVYENQGNVDESQYTDECFDYDDSALVKEDFIDIVCPHCGQELSILRDSDGITCPWCDKEIKT